MTPKQAHLLIYIGDYINDHNQAPTMAEMAKAMGYKHAENIAYNLDALIFDGYIKSSGRKRGITIVKVPKFAHPVLQANLEKAMAWEWRRDTPPSVRVKTGYPKTNPKLRERNARRRAAKQCQNLQG